MTPEKLKELAEDIHPSNVYEINGDEVWQVNLPKTDGSGSGRRTLAIQFNPVDCSDTREEVLLWLLGKGWTPSYYLNEGKPTYHFHRVVKFAEASDYTTALLQAAEKEMGNEMLKL